VGLGGAHSDAVICAIVAAAILFPAGYLALRQTLEVEELSVAPGGGVTYRNWVGRMRTLSREAIARVVLEPVDVSTITPRPAKWYLFLVDGQDRCRLRVLVSTFVAARWTPSLPSAAGCPWFGSTRTTCSRDPAAGRGCSISSTGAGS
jgi:hypothetical protein